MGCVWKCQPYLSLKIHRVNHACLDFFFFLSEYLVIRIHIFQSWQNVSAVSNAQAAGTESIMKPPPHRQLKYLISGVGSIHPAGIPPLFGNCKML